MNWNNICDKVFCCFYLPNKKQKYNRLHDEFKRIGLLDSGILEFHYSAPSIFDEVCYQKIVSGNHLPIGKVAYANHIRNIENILQNAIYNDYDRIIICEDDISFLKDIDLLQKIFESIPDNYDAFQCDKFITSDRKWKYEKLLTQRINEHWLHKTDDIKMLPSAAFNLYTKNGIKELHRVLTTTPGSIDQLAANFKLNWAIADINACIQLFYNNSVMVGDNKNKNEEQFRNSIKYFHSLYYYLDMNKYNVPEEYLKNGFLN